MSLLALSGSGVLLVFFLSPFGVKSWNKFSPGLVVVVVAEAVVVVEVVVVVLVVVVVVVVVAVIIVVVVVVVADVVTVAVTGAVGSKATNGGDGFAVDTGP